MKTLPSALTNQYGTSLDVSLVTEIGTFTDIVSIPNILTGLSLDNIASQSVKLTMDDTNGRWTNILQSKDMHKTEASIKISGLTVFEGQIIGPIDQDRDRKTVTLTITSRVETEEYGFSPERGELDYVSEDAIGKAWPLVFGSPRYVPAVRVYHQPSATTEDRFCFVDPMLYENRKRLTNAYSQALYMFYYFDSVREKILEEADSLPYQDEAKSYANVYNNTNTKGYRDFYEALIQREEALQAIAWDASVEMAQVQAKFQEFNDRKSAQRIEELKILFQQLAIEANEVATKKGDIEGIIDYLQVLFDAEKNAATQQLNWLNQAYRVYENYLKNEEIICEQERCVKSQVRIRGTELPSGSLNVVVNNVKYKVTVSGDVMTLNSGPLPVYTDITPDTWKKDDDPCVQLGSGLDVIWLKEQKNLRGMYLLLKKRGGLDNVRHIVRVKEQVGLKVYFDLVAWKRDGSGGPRGQSVESLINEVLNSQDQPSGHPFDMGSSYAGFNVGSFTEFKLYGQPLTIGSYRQEVKDFIKRNPNVTHEELRNYVRLIVYERLDNLSQIEYTGPEPKDIYTIIGPEVEKIEAVCGSILPQWFDYYIPPEEYSQGDQFIDNSVGSKVRYGDLCDVYVANLIQSTVHAVHAYKKNKVGDRILEVVPSSYYTVSDRNLTKYTTTTIVFDPPLTELNEDWEDGIYVTQTSSVGRNVVDVVDWLMSTYTNLTPSNDIRATVDKYPVDFAVFSTGDTLGLVRRILYEARIGFRSTGSTYELVYLPEQPSSATTLTSADTIRDTYKLSYGTLPVTKLVATWNGGDYLPKDTVHQVVIRNNIPSFGLNPEGEDFLIYSIKDLVEKSAQFHMLRKSYSWVKVKVQSTPHKWMLEPLDAVTIDSKLHLVESASLDPTTGVIDLLLHSGTIVGTSTQFKYFWPKDADTEPWDNNDPTQISGSIK